MYDAMHERRRRRRRLTPELGGVVAVDVDDGDEVLDLGPGAGEAVAEVEAQQLLLRRVEPVPRREHLIVIIAATTITTFHRSLQQHAHDLDQINISPWPGIIIACKSARKTPAVFIEESRLLVMEIGSYLSPHTRRWRRRLERSLEEAPDAMAAFPRVDLDQERDGTTTPLLCHAWGSP